MKKTYCLYLDESGDFDKDLKDSWKNECLVGGYLVEKNNAMDHLEARKIVADAYRKVTPEDEHISDKEAFQIISHSTDLKKNEHLKLNKSRICYEILTNMAQKAEFVIFENYNKSSIISSSRTYLNILVDGIMQLLAKLISQNAGETVCLEVLAGYRVNTSGEGDVNSDHSYIALEEYKKRIDERLQLERVKRPAIYSSNSQIVIQCDKDKENHLLVPCDYICNFYITRTAIGFQDICEDGKTFAEILLPLYKEENIFYLNGSMEQERVLNHIQSQTYDAALYDICTGIIEKESSKVQILNNIKILREKQVQNILSGLSVYMNNVIGVERNIKSSIEYLERAEAIIQELSQSGFNVDLYRMDMKLYELAVYDHRGNLDQMRRLFDECQSYLKNIIVHAENIDYAFMFFNRYAVYLYDIFEFEKGFDLLNNLKKNFEAYELLLADFPGIDITEEEIHATQLGKILGTQVQYCRHLMKMGKMEYDEAVKISKQAIANFNLEFDRRRQYQYRAQIEAEAGHFDNAVTYFNKGWGINRWEDIFQQDNISAFGMYHCSFLMERFSRDKEHVNEIKKMLKKCRENETKIFSYTEFPGFLICANLAKVMINLKIDKILIEKYFKQALKYEHEKANTPLFMIFMLMIHAEYIGWLLKEGKNVKDEKKVMSNILSTVLARVQIPSIINICKKLEMILQTEDSKKYVEFGKLLQY